MKEIQMDKTKMAGDIQRFEERINRFTVSHNRMVQKTGELDAIWAGPAKEAYIQQYVKDCERLNEFRNLLIEMQEALIFAQKKYELCNQEVSAVIEGIVI